MIGVVGFNAVAWISYRWLLPAISVWLPRRPRNLILLTMLVLFGIGGYSEYSDLGMVVVPLLITLLVRKWGDQLRQPIGEITQRGENHESR